MQITVAVDPLHGVQVFHSSLLCRYQMHQCMFTFTTGNNHCLVQLLNPAKGRGTGGNTPAMLAGCQFQTLITFAEGGFFRSQIICNQKLPGILVKFTFVNVATGCTTSINKRSRPVRLRKLLYLVILVPQSGCADLVMPCNGRKSRFC